MTSLRHTAWNLRSIASSIEAKAQHETADCDVLDEAAALVDRAARLLSDRADERENVWTVADGRQLNAWFGVEKV